MVDTGGSGMVIEPDTKEYIQDFGGCILTENGEPGDHRADEYLFSGGFRL